MKRSDPPAPSLQPRRLLRAIAIDLGDESFIVFEWAEPRFALPEVEALTRAEREVVEHWARGESARTISERRGTSIPTVRNQLKASYAKLGVSSRPELIARLRQLR